jgi:hypothetical protein
LHDPLRRPLASLVIIQQQHHHALLAGARSQLDLRG